MGTLGRIAIGSRGQFAYGEEALWGMAVPPTKRLEFKTESMNNEIGNLVSEALDPTRSIVKRVRGVSNIGGDMAHEQNSQGFETLYKHALGDSATINKVDGGVRTQITAAYTSGTALTVGNTVYFEGSSPTGVWGLLVVYKDATTGLLTTQVVAYSANASATEFTITDPTQALPKGAWVFQSYIGADDIWDDVYTHYIEAAAVLPTGLTLEVGRDVAFFTYSGCKVNTVENTFTSQEILQSTFSFVGKGESVGGDLVSSVSATDTTFTIENFDLTISGNISAKYQLVGSGVSDWVPGGTFTGTELTTFKILIASSTTFDWSTDGGVTWTTGVAMSASPNTLENGVTTVWTTQTGYTPGDEWEFNIGDMIGFNPAGGTVQMESENDITYTGYDTYTGVFSGVPGAGAGSVAYDHAAGLPVAPQVSWGSPTDPPATDPLSSFQGAVYVDGVSQEVLSATFTLNNNLYTDKYQLGSRVRAGLPEQQRSVEGSLNVEFDDVILYRKFVNGSSAFFEIRCIDELNQIDGQGSDATPTGHEVYSQKHCLLPNIEYTGTTPQIGGPDQITHDLPFTALRDAANDMNELAYIFVNERTSI